MKRTYFDRVYESTYAKLMQYAIVHLSDPTDAEDAVQDVYVLFYRRIERYGRLDILSPEAFLKKMLKHEIVKRYAEREQQRVRIVYDAEEDRIPDEEVFENAVVDRALAEEIFRTAKALPQETYRTFALFYGFELKIPEIAAKLGVTKETVKTRLYRARNALRAKLDADSQQNRQKGNGEY